MEFKTSEKFKVPRHLLCLVFFYFPNEALFKFVLIDHLGTILISHLLIISIEEIWLKKMRNSRTELEIFIQLSTLIKGARYLTRFPSIHLTIAVTVVTFVKIIVINHHTIGRCGRWLETELCRLYTEIYRPPYEIC